MSFELVGLCSRARSILENYDYDYTIEGNRIVYYNYYAKTPLFALFLAVGGALVIVGCSLIVILF